MDDKINEWLKAFKRARFNAVYFVEEVWNKAHPDKAVELTEEEKQMFFDAFKAIHMIDGANFKEYFERLDNLKSQGYKDWEIF